MTTQLGNNLSRISTVHVSFVRVCVCMCMCVCVCVMIIVVLIMYNNLPCLAA